VDVVAALGDPVRREILDRLRHGPLAAGDIAAVFDISRPAISRHVRVLRAAGLVVQTDGDADGRRRVYQLDVRPLADLERWLARFRPGLGQALDALETEVHRTRRDRRAARSATTRSTA
jgi:DNA-binding transcriptional ArsR family regulator